MKKVMKVPGAKTITKGLYSVKNKRLEREVFGIKFPNPVGLAAGLDKDAVLIDELSSFGFGFIEIGTLTPKPQEGNPKPRLFRLPEDKSLINRMGFNNEGVDRAVERLKSRKSKTIIGGNIGKNKTTPNEDAVKDYLYCFERLFNYVDYFVVNVSSPNTPNLRALQEKEPLKKILHTLNSKNHNFKIPKPILLKIAPDLSDDQLNDVIEIVLESGINGVIATNTTVERSGLKTSGKIIEEIGAGGLSGKALTGRSTEVIRYLSKHSGGKFPIIGVGGIFSAQDAIEKINAGAALVQVYSGFIYEGPSLVKSINKALIAK